MVMRKGDWQNRAARIGEVEVYYIPDALVFGG